MLAAIVTSTLTAVFRELYFVERMCVKTTRGGLYERIVGSRNMHVDSNSDEVNDANIARCAADSCCVSSMAHCVLDSLCFSV